MVCDSESQFVIKSPSIEGDATHTTAIWICSLDHSDECDEARMRVSLWSKIKIVLLGCRTLDKRDVLFRDPNADGSFPTFLPPHIAVQPEVINPDSNFVFNNEKIPPELQPLKLRHVDSLKLQRFKRGQSSD